MTPEVQSIGDIHFYRQRALAGDASAIEALASSLEYFSIARALAGLLAFSKLDQ